tara:strand:+ start:112715 stop:114205 length:1491 start_codon:yes stop_codon:yes gene_type:complete
MKGFILNKLIENRVEIDETYSGQKDLEKLTNSTLTAMAEKLVKTRKEYDESGREDIPVWNVPTIFAPRDGEWEEISDFINSVRILVKPVTNPIGGSESTKGQVTAEYIHSQKILLYLNQESLNKVNKVLFKEGVVAYDVYFELYYIFYTTLLHELQHTYDIWRSKGNAINKQSTKKYSDSQTKYKEIRSKVRANLTPHELQAAGNHEKRYLNLPHEINARFTQALHNLTLVSLDWDTFDDIKAPWEEVYREFKSKFVGWRFLGDKNKRRLTQRVAKMYQEASENMKKGTEKYTKDELDSVSENRNRIKSILKEGFKPSLFLEGVDRNTCDCCKYFDFSHTQAGAYYGGLTHPLYHELEKGIRHELKYVSPKRYIEEIARGFGMSYDETMKSNAINWDTVKEYAQKMKNGVEFPIGYYKRGGSQEGRHRALAAMELGCNAIPVVLFTDVSRDEGKQIATKYKDLPRETLNRIYQEKGYDEISDLDWRTLRSYVDYRL